MADLKQEFEEEIMRFLFICPDEDIRFLVGRYKKEKMTEYVRLGCLALTFGMKKMFLKISRTVERDMKKFLSGLDILNGNLPRLEIWVNEFIANMRDKDAQALCREFWAERKIELDKPDFTARSLLSTM